MTGFPALYDGGDIVLAVAPGQFVDELTRELPADRAVWVHPDSAHVLEGMEAESVSVIVVAEADCTPATLNSLLAASRLRGWNAIVLSRTNRLVDRERLLEAGASAVVSRRLTPDAVATLVRETLLGALHLDHGRLAALESQQLESFPSVIETPVEAAVLGSIQTPAAEAVQVSAPQTAQAPTPD